MAEKQIAIKLVRSLIGCIPKHQATAKCLRLSKIGKTIVHNDTPAIRGMIAQLYYLLEIEERN